MEAKKVVEEHFLDVKFPILIEWTLDKQFVIEDSGNAMSTKRYKFPGFPMFEYFISLDLFDDDGDFNRFTVCFLCASYTYGWDSYTSSDFTLNAELTFIINDREPKKFSTKYYGTKLENIGLELWEYTLAELAKPENNFFKDNKITFRLEGMITFEKIINPQHWRMDDYENKIWIKSDNSDKNFVIVAENKEIMVQKTMLQKISPVFCAMFENGWKEAVEGRIVIPDFSYKTIENFVDLCCTNNLSMDKFEYLNLFTFADKYDINAVKEKIKENILLTPNNICEYANFYHEYNYAELVDYCIDLLLAFFQHSYPVKNMDILCAAVKLQFVDRASVSPILKKQLEPDFYKSKNDESDS